MNLDELQTARDRERQTDKLQQLRESFYQDAAEFIQQLRRERDRAAERADDPFDSPEVSQLSDEISTAETTVEAIYEKRIGKLVKAASFDAAGLPSEADGMTTEEQDLFEELVADIKHNRSRVMNILDGESPVTAERSAEPETGTPADPPTVSEPAEQVEPGHSDRGTDSGPTAAEPADDITEQESSAGASARDTPHTGGQPDDSSVSAADVMGSGPDTDQSDAGRPVPPDIDDPVPDDIRTGEESPNESLSETPATDGGSVSTASQPNDAPAQPSETHAGESSRDDLSAPADESTERETVLITDDIDTFVGFDDRDYDLAPNDVVTLPAPNAAVLVEQDVAREL